MQDRTCVVTGGGTGIGFATAKLCFELGAQVALLGRRAEVVEEAARQLDPTGKRALGARCDIRQPEEVEAAVARIREELGSIHVLINNAGGQFPCPAEGLSANGFEAVVRNNLLGTFNMTRETWPIPEPEGASA